MKTIVALLLVLALAAGGLWWFGERHAAQQAAEQQAAAAAEAAAQRQARVEVFGEEALADDIVWTDAGLGIKTLVEGTGAKPFPGAEVRFNYVVRLKDGTVVDRTEKPTDARIGQMISGVSSGLQQMQAGGKAVLFVPPKLGYGRRAHGPIPENSGLIFEVELLQ